MLNLIKAEFHKLRTSKMFYAVIILVLLQVALIYPFSQGFKVSKGMNSLTWMFSMQTDFATDILIGLFASDFIVTEFSSGYIKNTIFYGHKRINIFISKTIVYYTGVIIINSIAPFTIAAIDTTVNGYGQAFSAKSVMNFIGIFMLMSLIGIAIGSIGALAAFASRNANITICIIAAIDFAYRIMNVISLHHPVLEFIYNKIIFSQPGLIFMSNDGGTSKVLRAIAVSLVTLFITTYLSIYAFRKADIR